MKTCYERGMPTCEECGKFKIHLNANGKCPECNGNPDHIIDYRIWGHRELIERIEELERQLHVHEVCARCKEPMYVVIRGHHHTETGVNVTK